MCGIVGAIPRSVPSDGTEIERRIAAMTRALEHRGPDHRGVWNDGAAYLGAARLAILDTGPAGNQPMGKDHVQIVCNGEIYNYRALRRELEAAGHAFFGQSDTEVILHGYLAWGADVLDRLRGMFALGIWDGHARRLILARDRVGKKPLFYTQCGGDFIFASEPGALLQWPGIERGADLRALHHFLAFQYVPSPDSAFTGISKLPPGHMMEISPGEAPVSRIYTRFPAPGGSRHSSKDEAVAEFTGLFDEAVRLRMASDVPIGALLSGGVDSSAVVAFMSRHAGGKKLQTFSLGFSDPALDERPFARMMARHFDTEHHEAVLEPDLLNLLPEIVFRHGEPFADPSALPSFCISKLAGRHVTVLLTGDGGDEAFLGYSRYQACRDMEWARRLPGPLRRLAASLADKLPADADGARPLRMLRRGLARIDHRDTRRYAKHMAYFERHHQESGYGDALRPFLPDVSFERLAPYFAAAPTMASGAAWADLHGYLPDDLLVKLDIATMAHGLEARSPFLDHTLLDWALRLPDNLRGQSKAIVKAAIAPFVPREILVRPKQGFGIPLQHWLGHEALPLVRDILLSQRARQRGLFKPGFVEKLLGEHASGRFFHHTRLWAMLMLELWWMTWIDPPPGQAIEPLTL